MPTNGLYVLGIDPGKRGALAFVPVNGEPDRAFVFDMPEKETETFEILFAHRRLVALCALEKQHAHPRDGRVGAFTLGSHYGFLRGVLLSLGIPFEEVSPQAWQNYFFRPAERRTRTETKTLSVSIASELFPKVELWRRRGKRGRAPLHGRSDALLIAEYLRRMRFLEIAGRVPENDQMIDFGHPVADKSHSQNLSKEVSA